MHFSKKSLICFPLLFNLFITNAYAQDMQRVKTGIDTLCSPTMQGRGFVGNGDKIAANYLRNRFEEIGLKSFEESYFQFFKMDINTFPNKMRLKINGRKLKNGEDFIVNCISSKGKGKAKIIFLDTLIFENIKYQQKFLTQKLKNRILVFHTKYQSKMVELPLKVLDKIYAAKALIELKDKKLTASLSTRQLSNPIFEINAGKFDTLMLKKRKNEYVSVKKPSVKFKVDAILKKDYITQNLVGYLEGTAEPDSFIVFSAHYDHLGNHGKKVYFPGANDNASGISMLLELAHHYAKPENRLKYSIAFMAFGAEEAGLLGSRFYTQNPLFPLENIKFLLNVDLVGTGDEGATIVNGTIFKPEFNRLLQINQSKNYLPKINARGFAANSDHFYFTENKVKSFFLYTLGGITAYHDIYDRPETLPLTRYREVFSLIKDFIQSF